MRDKDARGAASSFLTRWQEPKFFLLVGCFLESSWFLEPGTRTFHWGQETCSSQRMRSRWAAENGQAQLGEGGLKRRLGRLQGLSLAYGPSIL